MENLVGAMRVSAGSGDAIVVSATVHAENQSLADQVRLATSGDTSIEEAAAVEIEARSMSGNLDFEQRTGRLTRARIEASSGDARVRLPRDASFQAEASLDGGDFTMRLRDAAVTTSGETRWPGNAGPAGPGFAWKQPAGTSLSSRGDGRARSMG